MCNVITDIQKARTIVDVVGAKAENQVVNLLLCAAFVPPSCSLEYEKIAATDFLSLMNLPIKKGDEMETNQLLDEIRDINLSYLL